MVLHLSLDVTSEDRQKADILSATVGVTGCEQRKSPGKNQNPGFRFHGLQILPGTLVAGSVRFCDRLGFAAGFVPSRDTENSREGGQLPGQEART